MHGGVCWERMRPVGNLAVVDSDGRMQCRLAEWNKASIAAYRTRYGGRQQTTMTCRGMWAHCPLCLSSVGTKAAYSPLEQPLLRQQLPLVCSFACAGADNVFMVLWVRMELPPMRTISLAFPPPPAPVPHSYFPPSHPSTSQFS